MSNIGDWADLMGATVTVSPFISRDTFGKATFGPPAPFKARVNNKTHFIRNSAGEEVVSRGMAWIASATPIDVNSQVLLPDGTTPLILDSNAETDEAGKMLYIRLDFA